MLLLGLTGGVGMGKSTAARFFAQEGCAVLDTDLIARELVAPGSPALAEIREHFGPGVTALGGELNRSALAEIVFRDAAARQVLEAILHPRIRAEWKSRAAARRKAGERICIVDIPLLFETAAEPEFDATIAVACSRATQRQRLLARSWTEGQIEGRCAAQWPSEQKMAHASHVIWSEGEILCHQMQVDRILSVLRQNNENFMRN